MGYYVVVIDRRFLDKISGIDGVLIDFLDSEKVVVRTKSRRIARMLLKYSVY